MRRLDCLQLEAQISLVTLLTFPHLLPLPVSRRLLACVIQLHIL